MIFRPCYCFDTVLRTSSGATRWENVPSSIVLWVNRSGHGRQS